MQCDCGNFRGVETGGFGHDNAGFAAIPQPAATISAFVGISYA
jgi:hypothetical protein